MRKKYPDTGPCTVCSLPVNTRDSRDDIQLIFAAEGKAVYYHAACMDRKLGKRDGANKPPSKQSDPSAMEANDILTRKQAAALLSVHPDTLSKMPVPSHPLPGTKRRRYLKSEIVEWVRTAKEMATGLTVRLH